MKSFLQSVRIAPKKANLVAGMVRGLSVEQASKVLTRIQKKASRILEQLLRSAVANAQHNDHQDPANLYIRHLVVNKAQSFSRGVPMSRGRTRPIRKFLSHIEMQLGVSVKQEPVEQKKTRKSARRTSSKISPA